MKKLLLISFLCLMFTVFTNTANSQNPGDLNGCCFWLEQIDPDQIVSTLDLGAEVLESAKYSLNPVIPGVNNGKAEYYYFRFINCLDPKAKLSIDWEFLLNHENYHNPLDATPAYPRNLVNVEIEWLLPLVNPAKFQGSGPLLSGMGLNSELDPYYTINNVKRAAKTDFPGQIDSSPNGVLFGYFNPYGVQNRWYNYVYADFLEWACANNLLRIKIVRYSTYDVKANFKLMQRTGGIDFQEYYITNQQLDYMGGHGAEVAGQVGNFWLTEQTFQVSDSEITVCSGTAIPNPMDPEGDPYINSPVIPENPISITVGYVTYHPDYQEVCGIDIIDSLITYTMTWNPMPAAPVKDSVAICGPGLATLTASDPYEDEFDFTFNWYLDRNLRFKIHTGKTLTLPCLIQNMHYYVYVTSTVNGCESAATQYVVWVNRQVRARLNDEGICPSLDAVMYCPTVLVTNGYGNYEYEWTENVVDGCVELTGECDNTQLIGVTVTDLFSGCTATVQANIFILDGTVAFEIDDITINSDEGTEENMFLCLYDADQEITGEPYDIVISCEYDISMITISHVDNVIPGDCEDKIVYTIERTWTLETYCGNIETKIQTINVLDNDAPRSARTTEYHIQTIFDQGCVPIIPDGIIESLKDSLEIYDNCTAFDNITAILVGITDEVMVEFEDGDAIDFLNTTIEYYVLTTDACGNERLIAVYLRVPPTDFMVEIITNEDTQCNSGENTFVLEAVAENGVGEYIYLWELMPNSIGEPQEDLLPDDEAILTVTVVTTENNIFVEQNPQYRVTVTDENGCQASDIITLTILPLPYFTGAETYEVLCYGGTETVVIEVEGGNPPYTYYYDDEEFDGTIELTAGEHEFTVIDDNGCENTIIIPITQPEFPLTVEATIEEGDEILCNGEYATVTITIAGGTPPYYYNGDEVEDNPFTLELPAEDGYTITITDFNECETTSEEIDIVEPLLLTVVASIEEGDEIKCNGEAATVTITIEGGTPPYFYDGDEVEAIFTLPILAQEGYTITITDANECDATSEEIDIEEPPLLTVVAAIEEGDEIKCNGEEATVTITIDGGIPPYYYNGEEVEAIFTLELPAEDGYIITITDSNECEAISEEIDIEEPPLLTVVASIEEGDEIRCYGENATVTITIDGGTPPYYYNGNEVEAIFTLQLPAQEAYTITITDDNECEATSEEIDIEEPDEFIVVATIEEGNEIQCYGENATVTITIIGGIPPYFYDGDEVEDNPFTLELPAEDGYTITITDSNECDATSEEIDIVEPPLLTVVATIEEGDEIKCNGEEATVTITIDGGTPPYFYDGDEVEAIFTLPILAQEGYIITITDSNECVAISEEIDIEEPPLLTVVATIEEGDEVKCYGENATVTITIAGGTPPYYYNGDEVEAIFTLQLPAKANSNTITYTITVTDDNECSATTEEFDIEEPPLLEVNITVDVAVLCHNGTTGELTASPEGGTGVVTFVWKDVNNNTIGTTATITNLGAGTYIVIATDANNCVAQNQIQLNNPALLYVDITGEEEICHDGEGELTAVAGGGTVTSTGSYTYLWSNGATTATIEGLAVGTYTVTVTDNNNCTADDSFTISYYVDLELYITATKGCNDPNITLTVSVSHDANLAIEVFAYSTDKVTEVKGTTLDMGPVLAGTHNFVVLPAQLPNFCGVNFFFFVASVTIDDIDCIYESSHTNIINYNNWPDLHVYKTHDMPFEAEANKMTVESQTAVPHFFRVNANQCGVPEIRLAVDYQYYWQQDINSESIPISDISHISNFLFAPGGGAYMNFITPMDYCAAPGSTVVYNNIRDDSHFPYQATNGWQYQNTDYDFFRLAFFNNRQIRAALSGFAVPGIYTIHYQLVTHLPLSCLGFYGNLHSGRLCSALYGPSEIIGGNNFYTTQQSTEADYIKVVLSINTMTIEVITNSTPPPPPLSTGSIAADFEIYPNPTKNDMILRFNDMEGDAQVAIVNLNGLLVYDQKINIAKETVNILLPDLTPGMYFVYVTSKDAVVVRKLIIEQSSR